MDLICFVSEHIFHMMCRTFHKTDRKKTDRSSDRYVTVYWNSLKVLYTEIKEIYDTLFYFFTDIRIVMDLMTITGE